MVAARLGQAQAALAEAKAAQLRSELVETDAVEKLWTSKLRTFRNRILSMPGRVQYLSARQTVVLQQELRGMTGELDALFSFPSANRLVCRSPPRL